MKSVKFLLICLFLILGCNNQSVNIHFINVGYGDCILMETENFAILVDGGDFGTGKKVVAYLRKKVSKIDVLIITHPHPDHLGGLFEVIKEFEIGMILSERDISKTEEYAEFYLLLKEKNIEFKKVKRGDTLVKSGIDLLVLNPQQLTSNFNDSSLVIKAVYKGKSILLTGDISDKVCNELVKLYGNIIKCNILKVPHHGKSGNMEFIKSVNPDIAVISVGESEWGGPHDEILSFYNELDIPVLRTDNNGDIIINFSNPLDVTYNLQE